MRRRLGRADALTGIVRAVNASLEPEKVAEAMIAGIADWIPVSGWLVLAADERAAEDDYLPGRAAGARLGGPGRRAAGARTGEGFCSADIARDRRFGTGADGAAVAGAAVGFRSRAAAGRLGR